MSAQWPAQHTAAYFEALWACGVLDTEGEPSFDSVVAALAPHGPAAVVIFDGSRRWCKARSAGLPAQWWATPAPPGWQRSAGEDILGPGNVVVGELAVFVPVGSSGPKIPAPDLVRLAGTVDGLLTYRRVAGGEAPLAGVAVLDANGQLLGATADLEEITGWRMTHMLGTNVLDLVHPDEAGLALKTFARSARFAGRKTPMDVRIRGADGSWALVQVTADSRLGDPLVGAVLLEVVDAPGRARRESLAEGRARLLEMVARGFDLSVTCEAIAAFVENHSPESSCGLWRVEGEPPSLCPVVMSEKFKLWAEALGPTPPAETGPPAAVAAWRRQPVILADIDAQMGAEGFGPHLPRGCRALWSVPAISSEDGAAVGVVEIYRTEPGAPGSSDDRVLKLAAQVMAVAVERERSTERLADLASHDPLTGMANRSLLASRVEEAKNTGVEAALLAIQLEGVEAINRSLGRGIGDDLLRAAADRLCSSLRETDTACRISGHHFAVLLAPHADPAHAQAVAERVVEAFDSPFDLYGYEVSVDVSVGIALSSSGGGAEQLLLEADAAAEEARSSGGAKVAWFEPAMLAAVMDRVETTSQLRRALSRDELVVYYQPKVDLPSGQTVGAEALVRWAHPQRGLLAPDQFIPLLEDSGLIVPAGRRILEMACATAASWSRPLSLSVNISVHQLEAPGVVEDVMATCAAAGLEPNRLILEITESVFAAHRDRARGAVADLVEAGVAISIDDFGTGYSSLSRLGELAVAEVKIDRSFVEQITDAGPAPPLLAAMVAMGHGLGLSLVAEGVETAEQAGVLVALGCHQAQGYLYGRPVPAPAFATVVDGPSAEGSGLKVWTGKSRQSSATDLGKGDRPPGGEGLDEKTGERAALGQALEARCGELEARLRAGLAPERRDVADLSATVLATRLIARWLVTGEHASPAEQKELARTGEQPLRGRGDLGGLTKSYLSWRDLSVQFLREEATRLATGPEVLAEALTAVRRSCDSSMVRMARHFDTTRTHLEALVNEERHNLAEAASRDQVTGLVNRGHVLGLLESILARPVQDGSGTAVLFIDLDGFKAINDHFGHAMGDEVLTVVGERLRTAVREGDTVARFGGDEFVVLAPGLARPAAQGRSLARRITTALREPISVAGELLTIGASIGQAEAEAGGTASEVIAWADHAMYQVKRQRSKTSEGLLHLGAEL